MHKRSTMVNAFILFFDVVLICVAFIIGSWLKNNSISSPLTVIMQNSRLLLFASVTMVAIFNYFSLYETTTKRQEVDEAGAVVGAVTIAMLLFEFMTLFYRDLLFKRYIIFMAWIFSCVLIVIVRIIFIKIQKWLYRRGVGTSRILIIGTGDVAHQVFQKILKHPETGLRVTGFIKLENGQNGNGGEGQSILGSSTELPSIIQQQKINKVIFAVADAPTDRIMEFIQICEKQKVEFQFVPRVLDILESRISMEEVNGIPLITVRELKLYGMNEFLKRTFDLTAASILVVLLSPLLIVLAVLIKVGSPGSVLFKQRRVGREGREFDIYKFRSMKEGAEAELDKLMEKNEAKGLIFKIKNDPRVTGIGRFLRKWSLDELPQLFNVIKGDMSLVGPRPPIPSEVAHYNSWHLKRLHINPGITGLWQVSGRSEFSFEGMVKLDLYYIESWSLWLDIKILFSTIPTVLFSKGAY